jgi:nucleotide-binding universal stress UspA family protein
LLLARVVKVPANISDRQAHEQEIIRSAEFYLDGVRRFLTNSVLKGHLAVEKVLISVAYGDPKEQILEIATAKRVDLILMTTHGMSFEQRFTLGSVAAQVLQHSDIPIILIKPQEIDKYTTLSEIMHQNSAKKAKGAKHSVVVTLDGTPDEEILIAPAIDFAQQIGGVIQLVKVVSPEISDPQFQYHSSSIKETLGDYEVASDYLEKIQLQIQNQGVPCYKAVLVGDQISETINFSKLINASILVMPSFGSSNVHRLTAGTLAEEVLRESHLPMMVVHPPINQKTAFWKREKIESS